MKIPDEDFFNSIDTPKLSEEEKSFLDQPLSKQELYDVIKTIKTNKTPGFDGLPIEFYIVLWPDICDLLLNAYNFSFSHGLLSQSQRNGIITLLPKKDKDPLYIKNYRPITLLTVDYKILAKCLANRLKRCMDHLIHSDQSGFLKGRYIGTNIRLILDVIEYANENNLPGSIVLLDIEKAFDSVKHGFLLQVLKHFNFSDKFITWIKTIYSGRVSYVMNNGFLTDRIQMEKGIFQGCPISPYLFLFVIEIMASLIRHNAQIKGFVVNNQEVKISLLADDSVCFLDGSQESFTQLFETLNVFSKFSGCKINLNKTEAVWIGSKRGCLDFPAIGEGISWKTNHFKTLGITLSLNINSIFDLNYKVRLKQIEQTINCWRMRNLSLIGKICVIKTLVLPQLLYLFSVLCIKIPPSFFKELNRIFYRFIWNGGRDRVQRKLMCNDFRHCGLKMIY